MGAGKKEIIELLDGTGIEYEIMDHPAIYTIEEAVALKMPHPEAGAKTLFIRDDKKRAYYLVVLDEMKRLDMKELREKLGCRPLKMASADDLGAILGLIPGAVTPLGVLNDEERKVQVIIDSQFTDRLIAVHPNENTATMWLQTEDLVEIIEGHGNHVIWLEI